MSRLLLGFQLAPPPPDCWFVRRLWWFGSALVSLYMTNWMSRSIVAASDGQRVLCLLPHIPNPQAFCSQDFGLQAFTPDTVPHRHNTPSPYFFNSSIATNNVIHVGNSVYCVLSQ